MAKKKAQKTVGPDDVGHGEFTLFASEDHQLPVKLTPSEHAARGQDLAQLHVLIEQREDNRKAVQSELKGEIDSLKNAARELRDSVATGEEPRTVKVEKWGNHAANLVRYTRTDNGEVTEERAMEADERQGTMFTDEDADDATILRRDGKTRRDGGEWGDDDEPLSEGDVDPVLPPEPGDEPIAKSL